MTTQSIAEEWVSNAIDELNRGVDAVAHDIDEILNEVPRDAGAVALAMFKTVVRVLAEERIEANALVSLPLPPTRRLVTAAPSLERLVSRRWSLIHPPEFVVLRPWVRRYDIEQYRLAVDFQFGAARPVHTFYRVGRVTEERERGWEFGRGFDLWADWTPGIDG